MHRLILLLCVARLAAPQMLENGNSKLNMNAMVQRLEALRKLQMNALRTFNRSSAEMDSLLTDIRSRNCRSNDCTSPSGSPVCVPKSLGTYSNVNELTCMTMATKQGAAFYRHRKNFCQLMGKCSVFSPNKCTCRWTPLMSRKEYLLLRVRAYSNDMPYTIWKGSETSMCGNARPGSTYSYKSPLFLIENEIPFTKVRMEFLTAGRPQASLTFAVSAEGRLRDEGVWLKKQKIIGGYPWSMSLIKRYKFLDKFFRLQGCYHSKVTRRFYVSGRHAGCPKDTGLMAVIEMEQMCNWAKSSQGYPIFMFSKNPLRPWVKSSRAEEMRIYGIVGDVDENLFMRSGSCSYC